MEWLSSGARCSPRTGKLLASFSQDGMIRAWTPDGSEQAMPVSERL